MRVDPERYKSKVTKPDDFAEFWEDVLEQASRISLNPKKIHLPLRSDHEVDVYEVYYDSLDQVRIAGWYSLPRIRKEPLPALLQFPGYLGEPQILKSWARKGYAMFAVAPRGKLRSNKQFNPGYPGLLTCNIVDRNTYSYRGFYVDSWRAVDFLLSEKDVDPKRIGVFGSSQGGGLTIIASAMRREVKAASAGAPFLCGFVDAIELTHTYPYEEINDYIALHPEQKENVFKTLSYFDGINFADKIKCPIIVNIGLQDNVCPPETGYTAFRSIPSKHKKIYTYDGHGHDSGGYKHNAIVEEFLKEHLRP